MWSESFDCVNVLSFWWQSRVYWLKGVDGADETCSGGGWVCMRAKRLCACVTVVCIVLRFFKKDRHSFSFRLDFYCLDNNTETNWSAHGQAQHSFSTSWAQSSCTGAAPTSQPIFMCWGEPCQPVSIHDTQVKVNMIGSHCGSGFNNQPVTHVTSRLVRRWLWSPACSTERLRRSVLRAMQLFNATQKERSVMDFWEWVFPFLCLYHNMQPLPGLWFDCLPAFTCLYGFLQFLQLFTVVILALLHNLA